MKTSSLGVESGGSWEEYVAKCPEFSRDRIQTFRDMFLGYVAEEGHDAICGLAWAIESIEAQGTGTFMFRNQPAQMDRIFEALKRLPVGELSEATIAAFQQLLVLDFETGVEAVESFVRRKTQGN